MRLLADLLRSTALSDAQGTEAESQACCTRVPFRSFMAKGQQEADRRASDTAGLTMPSRSVPLGTDLMDLGASAENGEPTVLVATDADLS
jgi:hypothetical protein